MSNKSIFHIESDELNLDLNTRKENYHKFDRQIKSPDSDVFTTPVTPNKLSNFKDVNEKSRLFSQKLLTKSDTTTNSIFENAGFQETEYDNLISVCSSTGKDSFKLTSQNISKPSNVDTTKVRKKIPGPAGTLPKLKEGQVINESLIQQIARPMRNHKDGLDLGPTQSSQSVAGSCSHHSNTWSTAISDLDSACPALFGVLERFSLSAVPKRVKMKTLPSCKVPVICALIESINLQNIDASIILKDPSGTMTGALHREIVKEYGDKIYVGSVLVLKQVGVFSPAFGRNCYLNITPNNLVRIYTKSTSPESQSPLSIIKVQDPHFLELSTFSESIMKLSDSSLGSPDQPNAKAAKASKVLGTNVSLMNATTTTTNRYPKGDPVLDLDSISQELLEDWVDEEEMENSCLRKEAGGSSIPNGPCNNASKNKSSCFFSVGASEDFSLLPSSLNNSSAKSGKISQSVDTKRNQPDGNPSAGAKKARLSSEGTSMCRTDAAGGLGTNTTLTSGPSDPPPKSAAPQGDPTKNSFKFKSLDHSISSNLAPRSILTQLECGGESISNEQRETQGESFEKLLEGLGDEMFHDF